jgi:ABC-type multidrug transport system fused ATPase/permease subunit
MIRRLLPYWQARTTALKGLLLLAVAAVVELALPWPVKWLVDYVFGGTTPPEWWSLLAPASTTGRILAICLTLVGITVVHKLAFLTSQYLLIDVGAQIVRRLRVEVCSHLHRLSLTYHDNAKVGDSIYRAAYDTTAALTLVIQRDPYPRRHTDHSYASRRGPHARRRSGGTVLLAFDNGVW